MADDVPEPKTFEERLALLEEAVKYLVFENDDFTTNKCVVFGTFAGLMALLAKRRVIGPDDEEFVLKIAEDVAERMRKAIDDGLDLDAYLKPGPKRRRSKRRPRSRK